MRRIGLLLLAWLIVLPLAWADGEGVVNPPTEITEEDGSPSCRASFTLKFSNGSVTDNGDGSCSVASGGGSGDISAVGDCTTGACFGGASGDTLTPASGTLSVVGDLESSDASPTLLLNPTVGTTAGLHMDPGGTPFWIGDANGEKWLIFQADGDVALDNLPNCLATSTTADGTLGCAPTSGTAGVLVRTVGATLTSVDLTTLNTGFKTLDTGSNNTLTWQPTEDYSADRTLNITVNDGSRSLIILGNATISQDYSTSGSPSFANLALAGSAPDLTFAHTGADIFHMGAEAGNLWLFSNSTDGAHLLVVDAANKFELPQYAIPCLNGKFLTVTSGGKLVCETPTTGGGSGDITDVNEGTMIDVTNPTGPAPSVAVDTTEGEALTWGAGGNASNAWTFNLSGTDPTMTFGSNLVTIGADLQIGGIAGPDLTWAPPGGDVWHAGAEAGANGGVWQLSNSTDAASVILIDGLDRLVFPQLTSCTSGLATLADGRLLCAQLIDEQKFWASSMEPLEAADSIPQLTKTTGTNVDTYSISFDATTDEGRKVNYVVPKNILSSSTVVFEVSFWSASSNGGSVKWDIRYASTGANGETWDQTLTTATNTCQVAGTVKLRRICPIAVSVATLGWQPDDIIPLMLYRDADPAADNMGGDGEVESLRVLAVRQ